MDRPGGASNTFPLMNGKIVPDEYLKDWESKGWEKSFFENTAAVQFNHRVLSVDYISERFRQYTPMFRGSRLYRLNQNSI